MGASRLPRPRCLCRVRSLGLELLSRGASHVTFFDLDRGASALVQRNLAKLGCERERARVVAGDVITAARRGRMPGAPFDVVLIDPPYALGTSQRRTS